MKNKLKLMLLLLCVTFNSMGQIYPQIVSHQILENNGKFGKVELGIEMTNEHLIQNPYDENEVKIIVRFYPAASLTPCNLGGNPITVEAFYYREFEFDANPPRCDIPAGDNMDYDGMGDPAFDHRTIQQLEFLNNINTQHTWRARFSPPTDGDWVYSIEYHYIPTNGGFGWSQYLSPGSDNCGQYHFYVNNTSNKGFIKKTGKLYAGAYKFDDGTPYFPTGTNLFFYDHPYCRQVWDEHYLNSIANLHDAGGNFARLLMSGDGWMANALGYTHSNGFIFNIEWDQTPVGNYTPRQNFAFLLDQLMEEAFVQDINLQLCLLTWGDVDAATNWQNNPFNQLSSLSNPLNFFSDNTAKDLWKRKLRYIISRWGYATNLFGWEVAAELDMDALDNAQPNTWQWVDDMSNYIRQKDPNHLLIFSGAAFYPDADVDQYIQNANIDIANVLAYGYTSLYNAAHFKRETDLKRVHDHQKPHMSSEFGMSRDLKTFEHRGSNLDVYAEFHNTIWSSSFSGASATSAYWWGHIFPDHWLGLNTFRHFAPLRVLIEEMDLTHDFAPISTPCAEPSIEYLNMDILDGNGNPVYPALTSNQLWGQDLKKCPDMGASDIFNPDINAFKYSFSSGNYEYANDKIFIEGLKDIDNNSIYGWMHKKDNFWWKQPHNTLGSPAMDANCSYPPGETPMPASAGACDNMALGYGRAVFNDICNGEYQIDYYSTYPSYPTYLGGPLVNGGQITGFTRRLFTSNNKLDVKLPIFKPLENGANPDETIHAPDYGYRISQVASENYKDTHIGGSTPEQLDGSSGIEAINEQVFFKGQFDDLMHQYFYDNSSSQWMHIQVGNSIDPLIDGDIANDGETRIFYRGNNQELSYYQWTPSPSTWTHKNMSTSSIPSSDYVHPSSDIESCPDQVFYRGTDNKMHLYYTQNNGTTWNHHILNSAATTNEFVDGDIETLNPSLLTNTDRQNPTNSNYVFYRSPDGTISLYAKTSGYTSWVYQAVSGGSLYAPYKAVGKILPKVVGSEYYCFYVGADGYIQYYKTSSIASGTWTHGYIGSYNGTIEKADLNSHLTFENNVLYYYGEDNISGNTTGIIKRYYWDYHEWRHSSIVVCPSNQTSLGVFLPDFRMPSTAAFVYPGLDHKVRIVWNSGDCEKCTDLYPAFKSAKNPPPTEASIQPLVKLVMNNESYKFAVYPNPASDKINIYFENNTTDNVSVKILNTLGIVMKELQLDNNIRNHSFSIAEYPRGVYYVQLINQTRKTISTEKVSLF